MDLLQMGLLGYVHYSCQNLRKAFDIARKYGAIEGTYAPGNIITSGATTHYIFESITAQPIAYRSALRN